MINREDTNSWLLRLGCFNSTSKIYLLLINREDTRGWLLRLGCFNSSSKIYLLLVYREDTRGWLFGLGCFDYASNEFSGQCLDERGWFLLLGAALFVLFEVFGESGLHFIGLISLEGLDGGLSFNIGIVMSMALVVVHLITIMQ